MRYALIIILSLVFLLAGRPDYLASSASDIWLNALTYHFYHANIFHLAANCLSIWYVFMVTPYRSEKDNASHLVTAFLIATLTYFTATRPVIGISNILFAIFGLRTPAFNHKWWRMPGTKVFFGITLAMLLIPQVSALTHITSFLVGTAVSCFRRYVKNLENDYRHAIGK